MSLSDEIAAEEVVPDRLCKVCRWVAGLDEEDCLAFNEYADRGDKTKLHRACSRLHPPLTAAYSTFSRHMRECR